MKFQMWTKFRSSMLRNDGKESADAHRCLNINDEYLCAIRTKSYEDLFKNAQWFANDQTSLAFCHHSRFSEVVLEPCQETISEIIESAIPSKAHELKNLVLNYFDSSAEASKICNHLLQNIHQIQSDYRFIHQLLDCFDKYSHAEGELLMSELNAFIAKSNPFSAPNKHDFELIRDRYSSVLHHLKSKRRKVGRKLKLITYFQKATGISIMTACGLIAITAIAVAAHTLTAFAMAPVVFSFPVKRFKTTILRLKFLKSGNLRKLWKQLDVAAKGTYILNMDFDTMSRLVARLHDEVEYNKAMLQFYVERVGDKFPLQIIKELKKNDIGFKKQVEELKEHVFLCLLSINRARDLVIKEITTSSLEELIQ